MTAPETAEAEEAEVFISEINNNIDSDVKTLRKKIKQNMEDKITDITESCLCGIFRNLYALHRLSCMCFLRAEIT